MYVVAGFAAVGIAAYLVAAYRHDRRQADTYTIVDVRRSTAVVDEAERIVRDAYTTDPSTWM